MITAPIRPDIAKSPFDHQVLVDAVAALKQNPWIREIRDVRRTYSQSPGDTIEIDCDYRAPIALVKFADRYTLVDNEGTVLPEQFTGAAVVIGRVRELDEVAAEAVERGELVQHPQRLGDQFRPDAVAGQDTDPVRPTVRAASHRGRGCR